MSEFISFDIDKKSTVKQWNIKGTQLDYFEFRTPTKTSDTDYKTTAVLRQCFRTSDTDSILLEVHFSVTIKSKSGKLLFTPDDTESFRGVTDIWVEIDRLYNLVVESVFMEKPTALPRKEIEKKVLAMLGLKVN